MEQDQHASLFNLSIEPVTKAHLNETAKWARFLAISGMVFLGLAVVGILFFAYYISSVAPSIEGQYSSQGMLAGFGVGVALFYLLLLGVWFFPLLFLLRFANKMKVALAGNDQTALNSAVQNLKMCLRYIGILTIIILALYAIGIVFGIIGLAAASL
ncbi:MAG TPA: hypothetical protein VEY06_14560 [Flavisolibacter sp.]|nr:hypothetical protein [Flavisolibacter sp.]